MKLAALVLVLGVACAKTPAKPVQQNGGGALTAADAVSATATRTVVFEKSSPRHDVFEGASFKNTCASDGECKVGGCSGEVCSAEEGVNTMCVVHPDQPRDATCGCVQDECVWYREAGAAAIGSPAAGGAGAGAGQGEPCPDDKCASGLTCVSYYGIAGTRGGKFSSCEIPCPMPQSTCPEGQRCVTISDGPGAVCRPL